MNDVEGTIRTYAAGAVTLRIRELPRGEVRLHVEHKSGAALMVPDCAREVVGASVRLETTGFDGTRYVVELDATTAVITASAPSAILGDLARLVLPRGADVVPPPAHARRITGDESTMPIAVDRPNDR